MTSNTALIEEHIGLARSLAWQLKQRLPAHIDYEDLVSYGMFGLVQAAARFDPRTGVAFSTFAYYRIRGEILDGLRGTSWFSRADFDAGKYGDRVKASEPADPSAPPSTAAPPADAAHPKRFSLLDDELLGPDPASDVLESAELRFRLARALSELPGDARQLLRLAYSEGMPLAAAAERLGMSRSWASRLHAKVLERLKRDLA